jgi:GTP-binding protein
MKPTPLKWRAVVNCNWAFSVETMRREGFELTVGRPRVVFRTDENGQKLEPIEEVIVDVDETYSGIVVQKLSERRAELRDMRSSGAGRQRLVFHAPTRGLIGYQGELMSDSRGTAIMNRLFHAYAPYVGDIPGRHTGALLSNGDGEAVAYAIFNLQDRGPMFIEHGTRVYAGMIVGEHTRGNDLELNVIKGKKLATCAPPARTRLVLTRCQSRCRWKRRSPMLAMMNWWKSPRSPSACAKSISMPTRESA